MEQYVTANKLVSLLGAWTHKTMWCNFVNIYPFIPQNELWADVNPNNRNNFSNIPASGRSSSTKIYVQDLRKTKNTK
jgi:hypothetical protein